MQYILLSLRDTWAVEQLQDDITRRADRHQQFEYVKSWDKNVDCGGRGTGCVRFPAISEADDLRRWDDGVVLMERFEEIWGEIERTGQAVRWPECWQSEL